MHVRRVLGSDSPLCFADCGRFVPIKIHIGIKTKLKNKNKNCLLIKIYGIEDLCMIGASIKISHNIFLS